jgi:hypothetical protein
MRCLLLVCLIACNGQKPLGGSGKGRIVLTTPFVGTNGFTSSIAVGRPVIVAIQREDAPPQDAAAEMQLQISGGPYRIVSLAAGQSIVWLDTEADYRFIAVRYGAFAGEEPLVRARPIRLVQTYDMAERITRDDKGCEQTEDVPISDLSMAPNQEVHVTIVGVDQTQNPSSGWLTLTPQTIPPEINLETPFIGSAGTPNTFIIRPAGELGATVNFIVTEAESKTSVTIGLATTPDPAPCEATPK